MDDVFRALADASRRRLLDRLQARNGQTLRELGEGLAMSRQAVSKHLAVLEAAGLVTSARQGREKLHYLDPAPIHELSDRWIGKYEHGGPDAHGRTKRSMKERRTMDKPEFSYVIYIQATPERVYEALTDAEFAQRYFGGWGPMSDWQVGSPVLWKMGPEGAYEDLGQAVLEAVPGRKLAYTWHRLLPMHRQLFDTEQEFEAARTEQSQVAFDIEPADPSSLGVRLTITHDGFDSPDSEMLKGVSGGWVMILSTLKTLLEHEETTLG
ncbi:MarR family transcriptional regulator [Streptomyces sp. SDr-06]|uniref:ArsR/SmtB family transcription factor n=1 Tax=Streptomyces sp. SDr-06 TaxID=2267702 RepID=UPI000DE9D2C7|nr:metalloregulator ArsR/SmtB family transcription factor [Streptomyces sp. SDr-06]RCH68745.1 MarR family transcriptional regulator [Streptomyces sp. SDr-06]